MAHFDILLINYTQTVLREENQNISNAYPTRNIVLSNEFNGAVAHLGSYVHRFGYEMDYIISFEDDRDELDEKLEHNEYLCIGISTTHCTDFQTIETIANYVRERKENATIIVGGPFIVSRAKAFSDNELNFIFRKCRADIYLNAYHGSDTLVQIVHALKHNISLQTIPNIYYKENKKFIKTSTNQDIETLDNCRIDWNLFKNHIGRIVPIRTAISCPFSCSYCSFPVQEGKYQRRSIEDIEKELIQLRDIGKTKLLHFIDDTINVPPKHFKEVLKMMKKNGFAFRWHSFFRCQFVDDEMLTLMKETGCDAVMLGFESGSQDMLNAINKKAEVKEMKEGHALIKKYGIPTIGYFFVGFPGETYETVHDTMTFINEVAPDFYYIRPWFCDTTTEAYRNAESYGLLGMNYEWKHNTMDYETAERICNDIPSEINNSIYQSITSTYIFDMIEQGIPLHDIKDITKKLMRELQ